MPVDRSCTFESPLLCRQVFCMEKAIEDCFRCIECLLFRALPEEKPVLSSDENDDEVLFLDPHFEYLQMVYDFLSTILSNQTIPLAFIENSLTDSFLRCFCHLFFSFDGRERNQVRTQIHRIYGKFPGKRNTIRRILQDVLCEFCSDSCYLDGVQDILCFYSVIIKGIALPIHPEHIAFLKFSLIPLLKKARLECCFRGIDSCITAFVKKDASLAVTVCLSRHSSADHSSLAEVLAAWQHEQGDRLLDVSPVGRVARPLECPAPRRAGHREEALRLLRRRTLSSGIVGMG